MALRLAQDADLDLVEVAPDARPPVAKLMDYGKFKYESDMKAREARRNQANTVLKEIRFRLKIDSHDYETKKGHVIRFLEGGDKVKVMIMFRGREQSRPEMGVRLLQRLAEDVADLAVVESMPKQDGRNMTMVLGPLKKKADAKAEQRRRADEINASRHSKSDSRRAEDSVTPESKKPTAEQPDTAAAPEPAAAIPQVVFAKRTTPLEPLADPESAPRAPRSGGRSTGPRSTGSREGSRDSARSAAPRSERADRPERVDTSERSEREGTREGSRSSASRPATSAPRPASTSTPRTPRTAGTARPTTVPQPPAASTEASSAPKPAARPAAPKPATPKPATPKPPAPKKD